MPHTSETSNEYKVYVSGAKITWKPIPNAQKTHQFGVVLLLTPHLYMLKLHHTFQQPILVCKYWYNIEVQISYIIWIFIH